ncbi:hypothetical protein M9979_01055 [Sphingomonas sp. RP10(2022)]|uniref:Uncharacterized protein n=1 Tax=Sphingomonas liriopis TaxID=2949094 RepID=A0A9X2HU09_9SPHN|nr:hypothetical protein [Sphingomonas liriopis]MCP3733474.1 hypothetical protein [Sphingomonas liriopis]
MSRYGSGIVRTRHRFAWPGSSFAFSGERWTHTDTFASWCRGLGPSVTLDLNMNAARNSECWEPAYNLPVIGPRPDQQPTAIPIIPTPPRWSGNCSGKALNTDEKTGRTSTRDRRIRA